MAKLDQKTIKDLTTLSKIRCTDEEVEALYKDLSQILSYFDQLNELDTSKVAPCNQVIENISNVFRKDEVGACLPRETFLANAPSQIGGMIRVPKVIKCTT